jgi:uncharacterized membrane protein
MSIRKTEEEIEREFHVSWWIIIYKLFFGIVEAGAGILLIIFGQKLLNMYNTSVALELFEDPHDLLANISQSFVPGLLAQSTIIVIYLMILGGAKIAGAIGLINKQNWGVDLLVGLTIILFPFQIADMIISFSLFKVLYVVVGLLIALYLVEFKPKAWISKMLEKL